MARRGASSGHAYRETLLTTPPDLPVPVDDGAADHLPGTAMPPIALRGTDGGDHRLDDPDGPPTIVFAYPRTGRPGEDPPGGLAEWNAIPGARGCTPQVCNYRDHHAGDRGARWARLRAVDPGHGVPAGGGRSARDPVPAAVRRAAGAGDGARPAALGASRDDAPQTPRAPHPGWPHRARALSGLPVGLGRAAGGRLVTGAAWRARLPPRS